MLVGLVLFGLMPFDLSLSPALVYQKFAAGRVRLGPLPRLDGPPLQALTDLLTDVAVWVPAGFLGRAAFAPSPGRRAARGSNALAWLGCVVVAAAIEVLQLFVYSRVVDVSDVTLAAFGAGLGVWLAARVCRWPGRPAPTGESPGAAPGRSAARRPALLAAAGFLVWLGVVVVVLWQPFDFTADRAFLYERAQRLSLVPFRAYYFSTELRTVSEFFRKTFLFLPLGVAAAVVVRAVAARWRPAAGAVALTVVAATAAGIEVGKIFLPTRTFDAGNVLLEVAAAAAGYRLAGIVRERIHEGSARLAQRHGRAEAGPGARPAWADGVEPASHSVSGREHSPRGSLANRR